MGKRSYELGRAAEERATQYLVDMGFYIVERNFHSRFGEIDIIAVKESVLHFVEVKSSSHYDPMLAITPHKMQKILKTIDYFLFKYDLDMPYEVDALLVKRSGCELVQNLSVM